MCFVESLDHVVSTYGDHMNDRGVWCGDLEQWWFRHLLKATKLREYEVAQGLCHHQIRSARMIGRYLWQANNSNHWNSSAVNSLGTKFCYDYCRQTVSLCDSLHIYKLASFPPGTIKLWTYGDVIAKRRLPCERSQITMRASCMLWDPTMLLRLRRLVFFSFYQFTWVRCDCGWERER